MNRSPAIGEGIKESPGTYYSHAKQSFYSNMQSNANQYVRAPQTPNEPLIYSSDSMIQHSGLMQQTSTTNMMDKPNQNVKIASGGFSSFSQSGPKVITQDGLPPPASSITMRLLKQKMAREKSNELENQNNHGTDNLYQPNPFGGLGGQTPNGGSGETNMQAIRTQYSN